MKLDNPFLEVKPLQEGFLADVGFPVTGAEFRWNPMVETEAPEDPQQAAAAELKPLTLKSGTTATKIQVITGTVNSQTPTLGGTSLSNDPPPEITVGADVWVWIKCVGTFGSPDTYAITIETTSTSTAPASAAISTTGFTTCFLIGYAEYVSGTVTITNVHSGGNMGVESFGSTNIWFKV